MQQRRLFFALSLPPGVMTALAAVEKAVKQKGLRWVPTQNLHVTLLFLGNIPSGEVASLIANVAHYQLAGSFHLQLRPQVTAINRRGHTAMLWAEFEPEPAFVQLCNRISEVLDFPLDREPHPHVTLARTDKNFNGRVRQEQLPLIEPLRFPVPYVELWESKLSPHGAEYKTVERFYLNE